MVLRRVACVLSGPGCSVFGGAVLASVSSPLSSPRCGAHVANFPVVRLGCVLLNCRLWPRVPRPFLLRRRCCWDPRLTPEFRWAQRKGDVYITMNVANVRPEQTTARITDDGHVYWRGYGGVLGDEREYVLDIRLLKPIKTAESSIKLSSRLVYFKIRKAESGPYWDRLLADESRNVHCKIDWDAWKDEDEEDDYDFGTWQHCLWRRFCTRDGVGKGVCVRLMCGRRRGKGSRRIPACKGPSPVCLRRLLRMVLRCLMLTCIIERLVAHLLLLLMGCSILVWCASFLSLGQVPTGATRILPTWTLEMAMRTVAIVGRKTSTDRRDRGTSWCDVFPLVGCSPYAALPCHGDKSVAPLVLWLATCRVVCACHGVSKAGLPSRNEPFFLALLLVCPCSRRSRGCQSERRGCVKASVVASVLDRHLPRAYRVEE